MKENLILKLIHDLFHAGMQILKAWNNFPAKVVSHHNYAIFDMAAIQLIFVEQFWYVCM